MLVDILAPETVFEDELFNAVSVQMDEMTEGLMVNSVIARSMYLGSSEDGDIVKLPNSVVSAESEASMLLCAAAGLIVADI